jgi:hypothetical protein
MSKTQINKSREQKDFVSKENQQIINPLVKVAHLNKNEMYYN